MARLVLCWLFIIAECCMGMRTTAIQRLQRFRAGAASVLFTFAMPLATPAIESRSLVEAGMNSFRAGDSERATELFRAAVTANPRLKPYMWQLGLSEYFAGDFTSCLAQFQEDVSVNPQDTEEVLWAFLCDVGRGSTVDAARTAMIQLQRPDPRPIMRVVLAVFRGDLPEADLIAAGDAGGPAAYFYSRLYAALLEDALGQKEASLRHVQEALEAPYALSSSDYMVPVARAQLRSAARKLALPNDAATATR